LSASVENLELERRKLVLAETDMQQAAAAAEHLCAHGPDMNADAEWVVWTGLMVTYARPYGASRDRRGLGAVQGRLAKPEDETLRWLHKRICDRRNDLYAHNDGTDMRPILDIREELGIDTSHYVEVRTLRGHDADDTLKGYEVLPEIARLARAQEKRFRARLDDIEEELGRRRTV
jgi:hypothetical protein